MNDNKTKDIKDRALRLAAYLALNPDETLSVLETLIEEIEILKHETNMLIDEVLL